MGSKEGNMKDKEMDTVKKTQRRRPIPHQRGGSNTASLRTPKNTSISFGGERGWSAVKSLPSRKYDISTLMAIGKSGGMDSIVARFSSHSVENNIVRRDDNPGDRVLTEKRTNRIRGASRGSVGNEIGYTPAQESSLKHPCRQPHNAPQGKLAQTNSGFARFLKEHASPKHQRVTAGGRIVPMGPASPAPEFHLPNNILEEDDKRTDRKSSTACVSSESSSFGNLSSETRPSTQSDPRGEANNKSAQGQTSSETPGYTQASSAPDTVKANFQHQISPFIQMSQPQVNMVPVSLLQGHMPSGANIVGCPQPTPIPQHFTPGQPTGSAFGSNDQGFSSDQNLNQQHLGSQYLPMFTQQPIHGMLNTQMGNISGMFQPVPNFQMPISSGIYQFPGIGTHTPPQTQVTMNTSQTAANAPQDPAVNAAFLEVTREYESLSDQLSNLDRYLALHTWDIDPATKRALVDQRKDLVIKIDSARTNKELLEANLNSFKSGVAAGAHNNPGQYFQLCQSQTQPGDGITAPGFQTPFWNPNNTLNQNTQVGSSDIVGNTVASITPFANTAFTPTAPAQDLEPGRIKYGARSMGYERQHPSVDNTNYSSTQGQNWSNRQNCVEKNPRFHGFRSSVTSTRDNPEEGDDWYTPKKPAPPEISQVYSRIEEAARRGATVEKLLEDLALVTAKLNASESGSDNARNIQELQSVIERWGPKSQNRVDHGRQSSRKNQPLLERNIVDGDVSTQQFISSQARPLHFKGMKEGKGDGDVAEQHEMHRAGVEDASEHDDDAGSCCSDGSTNSWATIEVGDKRWLAREKSKVETPKGPEQPPNHGPSGQRKGHIDGEKDAASSKAVKIVKPKRSGGSRTVSLRQTTEWIESINSSENEQHIHDQSPLQCHGSQRQSQDSQTKGAPEQTRSDGKQIDKRNDIFALGSWSRGPESSQKVGTSTAFQNVNVHAFLPPFDGAGDAGPSNAVSGAGAASKKDGGTSGSPKGRATEPSQRWYMKPQREAPTPLEVRKFFRDIEEEERVMIEKYRARHPF